VRKTLFAGSLAVCLMMLFSSSTLLAGDNWLGTWSLNTAKSQYSPGPGPKSQTLKFEMSQDAITLHSDGVNTGGKSSHGSYTSRFDGKDVPSTGNPDADTASPRRIDASTYENAWKKDGKVTANSKAVVSNDGKTLTVTRKGRNARGEAVDSTAVFDRQ
jgi:hypothetical protein